MVGMFSFFILVFYVKRVLFICNNFHFLAWNIFHFVEFEENDIPNLGFSLEKNNFL